MSARSLREELAVDLDLRLDLDDNLTFFLPPGALELSGLRLGEPLVVDLHPLSLRLDPMTAIDSCVSEDLPLAYIDREGRIHLPFEPPLLTVPRVLLQLRQRGTCREIHLLADSR